MFSTLHIQPLSGSRRADALSQTGRACVLRAIKDAGCWKGNSALAQGMVVVKKPTGQPAVKYGRGRLRASRESTYVSITHLQEAASGIAAWSRR